MKRIARQLWRRTNLIYGGEKRGAATITGSRR